MKKYCILLLALTILLLAACRPSTGSPPVTNSITNATTSSVAGISEETQQTTETHQTTASTTPDPTGYTVDPLFPQSYEWNPDDLYPFKYVTGETPYVGGAEIDASSLQPDHLYVYDKKTAAVTHIADTILKYDVSMEHLFFIPEAEPMKIYRTDYRGEGKELIVDLAEFSEFDGVQNVKIDFYGTNAIGKFLLEVDQRQIFLYDMATETVTLLLEHENITISYYLYPERIIWGTINDQGKPVEYMYRIETGENHQFNG